MSKQLDLFNRFTEPTVTLPRARHTDDSTSHEAAMQHTRSGKAARHRDLVMSAVEANPSSTAGEIGNISGLGHIEAQRRLSDLYRDDLVRKGPSRKCLVKKNNMVTWEKV